MPTRESISTARSQAALREAPSWLQQEPDQQRLDGAGQRSALGREVVEQHKAGQDAVMERCRRQGHAAAEVADHMRIPKFVE